jgi:hypothetical protein
MPGREAAKRSSSGGISLSFVVGSLVAWCTNPTFVGWAGAAKSLLVGLGTSLAASIGGAIGFLGGGLVGGILGGVLFRSKKAAVAGAFALGVPCAFGGAVVGAAAGYVTVEDWLLNKDKANSKTIFNDRAGKQVVTDGKTFVLDAKTFVRQEVRKAKQALKRL